MQFHTPKEKVYIFKLQLVLLLEEERIWYLSSTRVYVVKQRHHKCGTKISKWDSNQEASRRLRLIHASLFQRTFSAMYMWMNNYSEPDHSHILTRCQTHFLYDVPKCHWFFSNWVSVSRFALFGITPGSGIGYKIAQEGLINIVLWITGTNKFNGVLTLTNWIAPLGSDPDSATRK